MIARTHAGGRKRTLAVGMLLSLLGLLPSGCSRDEQEAQPPYAASGGESEPEQTAASAQQPTGERPTGEQSEAGDSEAGNTAAVDGMRSEQSPPTAASETPTTPFSIAGSDATANPRSADDAAASTSSAAANADQSGGKPDAATIESPFTIAGPESEESQQPERQLRPNLSPEQLVEFLAGADQDMQMIYTGRSGIEDPKEARKTLQQIVKMKLEAARRLAEHPQATEKMKSEGRRGELQSLSHLASLGDLKSAEQLEELATANLDSEDPALVSDSRLVLIGFAIESLQGGDAEAAERIANYVEQIAESSTPPDVAALMVMGQARESLQLYEHTEQARRVRNLILELFAESSDPQIAEMAARMAGNVQFDQIDQLLSSVLDGQDVSPQQWREAVDTLLQESADMQTIQYLAGAALEFESLGKEPLVEQTYEALQQRFTDAASATGREVKLAMEARQARKEVIGQPFDSDLASVSGEALKLADYQGQVVLMPFWSTNFPQSLQLVQQLKALQQQHPDQVAIVGVNLDPEDAPVEKFVQANELGFPSFRAPSSPTADVANPLAARFGMVSLPFTVVLDQQGDVAAVNFTGRELPTIVERLLGQ